MTTRAYSRDATRISSFANDMIDDMTEDRIINEEGRRTFRLVRGNLARLQVPRFSRWSIHRSEQDRQMEQMKGKRMLRLLTFVGGSNNLDRSPFVRRATGDGGGLHHDIIADVLWSAQTSHRHLMIYSCSVPFPFSLFVE